MTNIKNKTKLFVVLAHARTGSNYLMHVLDSFPEIEFFGEIFNRDTVWMPYRRKRDYVNWLKENKGIDVNIGEHPFEDKELVEINHQEPSYFLDFLSSTSEKKYAGFKVFPQQLSWQKIQENFVLNQDITKLILKRNMLNVYISRLIYQRTNQGSKFDTSKIRVKVNCAEFLTWYFEILLYYSKVSLSLEDSCQRVSELTYEEIHRCADDSEKVEFIFSWLSDHGFELKAKPDTGRCLKRQDKRNNPLEKVENGKELSLFLRQHNLLHLISAS